MSLAARRTAGAWSGFVVVVVGTTVVVDGAGVSSARAPDVVAKHDAKRAQLTARTVHFIAGADATPST
jgi:hypothetical protein